MRLVHHVVVQLLLQRGPLALGQQLPEVKTDSDGNVYYHAWTQPHGERTVLTKNNILCVSIKWLRIEERRGGTKRYVMSAATYQRLLEAVK